MSSLDGYNIHNYVHRVNKGRLGMAEHALSIREMLRGDLVRLRYVHRYSTCRINHPETVAEHAYYVGLYAALIGQWIEGNGPRDNPDTLNWRELHIRTMIHDVEEAKTGDWPRHFKHSDPALKDELDRVAKTAMESIAHRLVTGYWSKWLVESWENAKDDTIEGRIVAFADFLSVLSYIIQEKESGNVNAQEHIADLTDYFAPFRGPRYGFIRPLVDETCFILTELVDGFNQANAGRGCTDSGGTGEEVRG